MSHDVFDDVQLSAMTRAIDQILEGGGLTRHEVAHAVFTVARECGDFDTTDLARRAQERLAAKLR